MSKIDPVVPPVEAPPKVEPPKVEPPKVEAKPAEPVAPATTMMGGDKAPAIEPVSPGKEPAKEPIPEDKKEAKAPEAPVVPDKYELKVPEGSALAPEKVEEISRIAKEKGLTNAQAQVMLEREDAVAAFAKGQTTQFEAVKTQWFKETTADPEIGGANVKQNVDLAHSVVKTYGSQKLQSELNRTGLGNHPELVRMLVKIGKASAPDKLIKGGEPPPAKKSTAEKLFPSHGKSEATAT